MPVSEFMQWYMEKTRQLDEIGRKLDTIASLKKSVPPLNYVGRIIISYTDDTEQKVIANYGGKSWRRIENFLRGVGDLDPDIGKKLGEEYVELRQSNIPLHSHVVKKVEFQGGQDLVDTDNQEWMAKNPSGK